MVGWNGRTLVGIAVVLGGLLFGGGVGLAADWYVDGANGSDQNAGDGWNRALASVGEALSRTLPGDTIHVAEGRYAERITLVEGVSLLGGYPSGGAGPRDPELHETVLDGQGLGTVVVCADDALLDRFTITGGTGFSRFDAYPQYTVGGGIYCRRSSPEIRNCIITDNSATNGGGGVFVEEGAPKFIGCVISGNRTTVTSGGAGDVHRQPRHKLRRRTLPLELLVNHR